jgi:hypothetical protein
MHDEVSRKARVHAARHIDRVDRLGGTHPQNLTRAQRVALTTDVLARMARAQARAKGAAR